MNFQRACFGMLLLWYCQRRVGQTGAVPVNTINIIKKERGMLKWT